MKIKYSFKIILKLFIFVFVLTGFSLFVTNTIISYAEDGLSVTTEQEFINAIASSDNNSKTITLERNISLSSRIEITTDSDKCSDAVIDLNGHRIYRMNDDTNDTGQVFSVSNGAKLTLKDSVGGSSISGGNSKTGGAIYNSGTLAIENVTLNDNYSSSFGGAIFSIGDLTLNNVVLKNNKAKNGGAISVGTIDYLNTGEDALTATITNCTISNNYSNESGGAIYLAAVDVTISDCEIKNNNSNTNGGAICNTSKNLTIDKSSFSSNSSNENGGAIYTYNSSVCHFSNSTFTNNEAMIRGGAIFLADSSSVNLSNATITENMAWIEAGAVYFGFSNKFLLEGKVNIINNKASIGKNILITESGLIEFNETGITSDSKVDVTLFNNNRVFSNGFSKAQNSIDIFSYNEITNNKIEKKNDELFFSSDKALGDVYVKTWDELKDAAKKDENANKTIVITANLYANGSGRIEVKKNVTIDLNGYTVDRQRNKYDEHGNVFEIKDKSTVTIKDSIGTGIITGGYAKNGGGIYVNSGSKLILEAGSVMNNKSSIDGGGIFVCGELDMKGGNVIGNHADDNGGGIHLLKDGKMNISNANIIKNISKNNGGGLCFRLIEDMTIENTLIQGNTCETENAGAFYMDSYDKTLNLNNTKIKLNFCDENGGAIYINKGTININNSLIFGNTAKSSGGGIFNNESTVILNSGEISYNTAISSGGGIQNEGVFEMHGGSINNNSASANGGGININDGATTNISGGQITNNKALNGGGISLDKNAKLNLSGGTITLNSATKNGGGINFGPNGDRFSVCGNPVVTDNTAVHGLSIYIEDHLLDINGELLDGAQLYVEHKSDNVVFTTGYSKYNTLDPANYFLVDEEFKVTLSDNEACIQLNRDPEYINADSFIDKNSQVASSDKVTGKNWMSAISGERKLNEINIPGAHDAAMNNVKGYDDGHIGTGLLHWENNAKTQVKYIDEMLNDGVRLFDIRLSNYYRRNVGKQSLYDYITFEETYEATDDGTNIWIVHGKTWVGGVFYAQNRDGNDLSLKDVFSICKEFLALHPTETIILEFKAETNNDNHAAKVYERLYDHLIDLSLTFNASTNKSFVHTEDGDISKAFTDYPYLKDTRGQIVVKCGSSDKIGGLKSNDFGGKYKTYSQSVGYDTYAGGKIDSLKEFFKKYGNQKLLTNANEHFDFIYNIGTNCAPSSLKGQIKTTPLKEAKKVIDALFQKGGYFDRPGYYLGWVKTDGLYQLETSYIWKSNFFDDLEYCDITVNSGLETDEFECQTYTVLKGTTINIPGLIYDYDEKANSNYLIKWKMNDTFYYEGDSVLVDDSLTFTGFWSSEPNYEEKVKNVIDNIDKIGTVEYSKESYDKISNARNLYDALTDELKEGVTNYETLSNAEEAYYNLANTAKSNEIIALIDSIGEVKYPDSYQAIINSRFSYTVLNSVQKELVTNYETLLAAEEAYTNLENTYKANTVIDLIDQIGELTATTECLVKIESAYEAYYDLTSTQRKLVTNYETLINAIDGYYNLVNQSMANVTIGLIESIGEVKYPDSYQAITSARSSYNSLNNVQKQLVTNYDVLKNAEATYKTLLNDYNLAINAITLIDNIGEVSYPSSLKPIMDATMAYNSLTDSQKNLVTNHDELVAKQEQFNQLLSEDISLVENTIYFIDSIKTVVYPSSLSSIKSARKLYDSLNDSQKERVTNYDVLVQAEQAYDYLEKEYLKAKDVMDKISALSDISYTTEYEAKLADARQSYDNLTDDEKSLVTNYDLLESSEKNYLKLDNVYNKIELIGEVSYTDESYKLIDDAYDAYFYLNDELQNLIPNKDKLEAAINKYAILKVTALINNIGEVKYPDSKSLISDARTAYDLLSSGLKTSVENYDTLLNAESKYSELLHEYFKQATDVIDLINSIGEVKYPTSYNQIEDVRDAYDGLSIDQKSLVTNYETLTSAEEAYDELEKNYKEDSHIAGTVIEKIYNILKEEYGVEREIAIKDAEESYNELTDTQKPLVTNYYLLIINKNTYNTYKDVSSAQKVIDRIDLIGTVVYSQSSLDLIENARFSYDTTTDIQKTLVSNYSALEAAEATYAKLKVDYENALNVEASINGIGDISYTAETKEKIDAARSGYNNLTDDQKALVTNYKVLETSENTYSSLEIVYNKIEEIGEVTYQKETKDKIDAARNAYDSLEDGLKEKITNYDKLLSAEEAYNKLDSEHTFRTILMWSLIGTGSLILLSAIIFIINTKRKKTI